MDSEQLGFILSISNQCVTGRNPLIEEIQFNMGLGYVASLYIWDQGLGLSHIWADEIVILVLELFAQLLLIREHEGITIEEILKFHLFY